MKTPKKFVNLHGHSGGSIGDALGLAPEHMNFALGNGADALAITDHGNMAAFSHQFLQQKKFDSKGVNFKSLYGVESYVIPSLDQWRDEYKAHQIHQEEVKALKKAGKGLKLSPKDKFDLLDPAQEEIEEISAQIKSDKDSDEGGTIVENEEESKGKVKNPLRRRSHLVLLAKNNAGLNAIFEMCSRSFRDGFYYFPRIDLKLLKELSNGNVMASTACIVGNAILETNFGKLPLKEVVELVGKNKRHPAEHCAVHVMSCEENKKDKTKAGMGIYKKITAATLTRKNAKVICIKTKDGQRLTLTPDHKVFTNRGWVPAGELKTPDKLVRSIANMEMDCARWTEFDRIEEVSQLHDVYDITVEDTHCFFADRILVHNCIGGPLARIVFDHQKNTDWQSWHTESNQDAITFELIQAKLKDSIEQYVDALGKENFFIELQFNKLPSQHLVNMHLMEASKRTGVPLIATADAHYANPAHWREREIYKMMAQLGKNPSAFTPDALPKTVDELKCELYPKNADQMWDAYKKTGAEYNFYDDDLVREAIERTHDIAHELIGKVEPDRSVKLPSIEKLVSPELFKRVEEEHLNEDTVAFKELIKVSIEGMKRRKKDKDQEYILRLKHELDVIKTLNFSKYFLTYYHIMNECAKELFLGNARGSAGGSIVAWALGITQVDPIKYGLLFERFLTRFKKGYPDIDSDFSDRDQAVKIVQQFFGEENVVPVTNFSQLQLKSLIKDLCRLYGLPFDEVNALTRNIETEVLAEKKKTPGFDRGTYVMTYDDAKKHSASFKKILSNWPQIDDPIAVLFKQMRGIGRHAGGVIVTHDSVKNMPMIVSGKGDSKSFQTAWAEGVNYRHLEELGFLKFDLLGLATLRMFDQCIRKILKRHKGVENPTFEDVKKFFYDNLHPDTQEFDDMTVYEHVYWNKHYAGIFQFIKPNVKAFSAHMRPKNIIDIAAITSIHRPGPLAAGVDKIFLENRMNPREVEYLHPLMEDALRETEGTLVFQEQLQFLVNKLAGVPLEQTDDVRKAFTKKEISNKEKAAQDRDKLRKSFAEGCWTTNQIKEDVAGAIFDYMENLVSYSFNKSHAVAYAITSYQCAWLLTYYPEEWLTTYLDHSMSSNPEEKAEAVLEVKRLGYGLAKPDINFSDTGWSINDLIKVGNKSSLVASFTAIKGIGEAAIEEIKKNRPYKDAVDLLIDKETGKWKHSKFNRKALSNLIQVGAFESMDLVGKGKTFENYKQMHMVLIDHFDELKKNTTLKKKASTFQVLFDSIVAKVKEEADWTIEEKIAGSMTLLGSVDIDLIVSPELKEKLAKKGILSIDSYDKENGVYWAIVQSTEIQYTKNNDPYMRMKLMGEANAEHSCFVWQRDDDDRVTSIHLPPYSVIVLTLKQKEWNERVSFETKAKKIRKVV